MQGHRGTARQGRRRGTAVGGVGEGSRRGQRGSNRRLVVDEGGGGWGSGGGNLVNGRTGRGFERRRPPPADLAQGDWAGAKSFRRGS